MKKLHSYTKSMLTIAASLTLSNANAAVIIDNTGSFNGNIAAGETTLDNLNLATTADTAVFMFFSADTAAVITASFAGESMTVLQDPTSSGSVLAYLANPTHSVGDLILNTSRSGGGSELAYWGVASGIDTNRIQTTSGSNTTASEQLITPFSSLNNGDIIYSMFAINAYTGGFPYTGGLATQDGAFSRHEAVVTSDMIYQNGSHIPTVSYSPSSSANSPAGVSIAFTSNATSVPEPSVAFLGLSAGLLAICRRRRRS